jgi:predicted TIM-barrel fold metal-dependent hydrolase
MRLTLQPLDESPDPAQTLETIEQLGSDEMLMFSTDYPHYHFDAPEEALPSGLPEALKAKIMSENARGFYRLGSNEQ